MESFPRTLAELEEPLISRETAFRLKNASVIWADYELILRDFPYFRTLAGQCGGRKDLESSIDSWLVRHGAVISNNQQDANDVNDQVDVLESPLIAYRPPRYGRALIVEVRADSYSLTGFDDQALYEAGLLDVKGSGVDPNQLPRRAHDGSGLIHLPDALSELIMYKIINAIFDLLGVDVRGVGIYALFDLGFWYRLPHGALVPAGSLVRQAHRRFAGNIDVPVKGSIHQRTKLQIELILRQFGLTSAGLSTQLQFARNNREISTSYGGQTLPHVSTEQAKILLDGIGISAPCEFDCINVQMTRDVATSPLRARLFDFGQYEYRPSFDFSLLSLVSDRAVNWGGALLKTDPSWIQPSKIFALNGKLLDTRVISTELADWRGPGRPRVLPGVNAYSSELTQALVQNRLNRQSLRQKIDEFVEEALRPATKYFVA